MKTYRGIELKGELKKIAKGKYNYCGRIIENRRVYSSWYNKIARRHQTASRNQWVLNGVYLDSLTDGIELVNEWIEKVEQERGYEEVKETIIKSDIIRFSQKNWDKALDFFKRSKIDLIIDTKEGEYTYLINDKILAIRSTEFKDYKAILIAVYRKITFLTK